ncbi:MAG: hypothetical protein WDO72_14425 [Pseudomonadota bacterium]
MTSIRYARADGGRHAKPASETGPGARSATSIVADRASDATG